MSGRKRTLSAREGFVLTYEASGELDLREHAGRHTKGGGAFEVAVSGSSIRIVSEGRPELRIAAAQDRLQVIEHDHKRYRAIDAWQRSVRSSAHRVATGRQVSERNGFAVRSGRLTVADLTYPVWTLDDPVVPGHVASALWQLLIPGIDDRGVGAPAEISITTELGTASLKLVDIAEGCDEIPSDPPDGYVERSRESRRSASVGSSRSQVKQRHAKAGRDSMTRQHALRSQGQDAAFTMDQAFLDDLRSMVNGVTSAFSTFYGDGDGGNEPMHVELDWWSQLQPRLDFGSSAVTADVLDGIRMLLVYLEVSQGNDLPPATAAEPTGLTAMERVTYATVLADAEVDPLRDLLGIEAARVLGFQSAFGGPRRLALGALLFDRITATRRVVLGTSSMNFSLDFVDMEIWDFDTTIEINHQGIVDQLRFEDGRIRARLALDRLHVDFQFNTLPDDSVGSILCNIFTLGACATVQANYGYGFVSADDVEIAIDITPQLSGGNVTFQTAVDRDDSSMDIDMLLIGVNPIADIVDLAASAVISWFTESVIEDRLYPAIEDEVPGLLTGGFLDWPSVWHAMNGPEVSATAALFSTGAGVLEAEVSGVSGLPAGIAAPVDESQADPLAYAVSGRFLTAWLWELIPDAGASTSLPLAGLLGSLGVSLPSPESADTGEEDAGLFDIDIDIGGALSHFDGCDSPPSVPADEYRNALELKRSRPVVTVPPSGTASRVGDVSLVYRFEIAARKARSSAVPRFVQEPCFERTPGGPRGPQPDPLPPWVDWLVAERLGFDPRVIGERGFGRGQLGDGGMVDPLVGVERIGSRIAVGRGEPVGITPHPDGGGPGGDPDWPGGGWPPEPVGGGGGGIPWPPEPSGGEVPDIDCPPPHCEWSIVRRESTLETYLSAEVRVTATLHMGFNDQFLSFWIPDIRLALIEDSADDLDVTVTSLNTEGVLAGVDEDDLRAAIIDRCRTDAWALLGGLEDDPARRVRLIPAAADLILTLDGISPDAIAEIGDLFDYEQSAGGALIYESDGNLVYWSITFGENISDHVT